MTCAWRQLLLALAFVCAALVAVETPAADRPAHLRDGVTPASANRPTVVDDYGG